MINNIMLAVGACFCLLSGAQTSRADFALNWAPDTVNRFGDNTLPYVNCNRGEQNVYCIDQSARISPIQDPDKTPFLQERVVGSDGQVYYHVFVGLPTSTFAQETFIRAGGALNWGPGLSTYKALPPAAPSRSLRAMRFSVHPSCSPLKNHSTPMRPSPATPPATRRAW